MNLLVLLAIVLLIIAGHQLLRIIELSRGLKKTKEWQVTDTDNNMMGKALLFFMFIFFAFFFQFRSSVPGSLGRNDNCPQISPLLYYRRFIYHSMEYSVLDAALLSTMSFIFSAEGATCALADHMKTTKTYFCALPFLACRSS